MGPRIISCLTDGPLRDTNKKWPCLLLVQYFIAIVRDMFWEPRECESNTHPACFHAPRKLMNTDVRTMLRCNSTHISLFMVHRRVERPEYLIHSHSKGLSRVNGRKPGLNDFVYACVKGFRLSLGGPR